MTARPVVSCRCLCCAQITGEVSCAEWIIQQRSVGRETLARTAPRTAGPRDLAPPPAMVSGFRQPGPVRPNTSSATFASSSQAENWVSSEGGEGLGDAQIGTARPGPWHWPWTSKPSARGLGRGAGGSGFDWQPGSSGAREDLCPARHRARAFRPAISFHFGICWAALGSALLCCQARTPVDHLAATATPRRCRGPLAHSCTSRASARRGRM